METKTVKTSSSISRGAAIKTQLTVSVAALGIMLGSLVGIVKSTYKKDFTNRKVTPVENTKAHSVSLHWEDGDSTREYHVADSQKKLLESATPPYEISGQIKGVQTNEPHIVITHLTEITESGKKSVLSPAGVQREI